MSNAEEFFSNLQPHSEAKLKILNNYLIPWMRKVILGNPNSRCLIIDGFAGPGIYDDDKEGSPVKITKAAMDFYDQCKENGWREPRILLLFIEGHKDNYIRLMDNITKVTKAQFKDGKANLPDHPSISVACTNMSFDKALKDLLSKINPRKTLIPSFCFIDPFGLSHTPFELFKQYLSNEKAELLFNFMFEEINRFLTWDNEGLQQKYNKLFGVEDLEELKELIGEHKGELRKKTIVDYYSRQLTEETDANFVLNFEFKKNGRTKMFLFYATKSPHGLKLMKQVMWQLDDTGMYLFDDAKNSDQIEFEFLKDFEQEQLIHRLAKKIHKNFSQKKSVSEYEVESFVLEKTIFPLENYYKPALVLLEKEDKIYNIVKKDGKDRRRYTFSNVLIDFK